MIAQTDENYNGLLRNAPAGKIRIDAEHPLLYNETGPRTSEPPIPDHQEDIMGFSGILRFAGRAGLTALAVCIGWTGLRIFWLHARGRKWRLKDELPGLLGVFYLAALIEITVWRGGERIDARAFKYVPLETTIGTLSGGLWSFVYHLLGNLIWFVPLGVLLGLRRRSSVLSALLVGAALSAAIEAAQYLRQSGVSDIDDVLVNALGTLIGTLLARWFRQIRSRRKARG